jgi:regulator of PEP synthase PpsR (kinase-PPPase family)
MVATTDSPTSYPDQASPAALQVYVLSGGVGASGEQLVRTVMAQFPEAELSTVIFPKVSTPKRVREILKVAAIANAIVAHTFVDRKLRRAVVETAQALDLVAIDLVGPLMEDMAARLGQEPLGKPGLYRQLYRSYFDRVDAIDYSLKHDDGQNADGWEAAEIVLLGASRVGKTPISLYLAVLGWKVANVPLVAGISPRQEILELDKRRMVGLTMAPSELVEHRRYRQRHLGVGSGSSDYIDPVTVYEEIEEIEGFLRRNGITSIDVTGKPIETSADEIIRVVRRKLK